MSNCWHPIKTEDIENGATQCKCCAGLGEVKKDMEEVKAKLDSICEIVGKLVAPTTSRAQETVVQKMNSNSENQEKHAGGGPIRKKPVMPHTAKPLAMCRLCKKGFHRVEDCDIISDPHERFKVASNEGLCTICGNHKLSKDPCRVANKPCGKCGNRGHQKVFCFQI